MPGDPGISIPILEPYRREIGAVLTIAVAFVIARLVDRAFRARTRKSATDVQDDERAQARVTRVRLVRRLVFAIILVIGFALALS